MEIKLPDNELIKKMAEIAALGEQVYYNIYTGKWEEIPYDETIFFDGKVDCEELYGIAGIEEEECEEYNKRLKNDFPDDQTVKIKQMPSYEAYERLLKKFIEEIDDPEFANKLRNAINGRGAFRRFRQIVDNSDYYEQWLEHREREELLYFIDEFKLQMQSLLYDKLDFEEVDKIIEQFEKQTRQLYKPTKRELYENLDDLTKLQFLDWLIENDPSILNRLKEFIEEE